SYLSFFGTLTIFAWQQNFRTKAAYIKILPSSEQREKSLREGWSIHLDQGKIYRTTPGKFDVTETEKFIKENSAKRVLTKKTDKTRNSITIITDDREDSMINNVFRSRHNTKRPLRSIQNKSTTGSNRIELGKKRVKQNEQEIKLTQDENLFKKDSILEQILNRLQKIEEKQGF
ncbi:33794_t:CDS:2, partial [Gigaspora margarita]